MEHGTEKIYEDIAYSANRLIVKSAIDYLFTDQRFQYNLRKNLPAISPSGVDDILEDLGWERDDFDDNGWQQDTWYYYSHTDYPFRLVMAYGGFYGDMQLYRSDIDDE